jgi:hypothetical protein
MHLAAKMWQVALAVALGNLAVAQRVAIDLQPLEFVCDGSVI